MNQLDLFAAKRNIDIDTAKYLTRNVSCLCKCGEFKSVNTLAKNELGVSLGRTCGKKECWCNFGKKRPNQSIIMKNKAINGSDAYKATLMKKGELFNKEVNSIQFKKKVLEAKGIIVDDVDVISAFSTHASSINKSSERRCKQIVERYNAWEDEYKKLILLVTNGIVPELEWITKLPLEEMTALWSRIHGINTIRNGIKVARPGWFKRIPKSDFKYNTQGIDKLITRSGLESDYIDYFESNSIPWSYEEIVIETIKKDGFHIPDFKILVNGQSILLEVKGSFYRQDREDYIANKVASAINYAKENGMRYILTQCQTPKDFMNTPLIDTGK